MENAPVDNSESLQTADERRKQLRNERGVLRTCAGCVPAEDPDGLTVLFCNDLGREFRSPLRKEVGYLKVLYPALPGGLYPPVKEVEAEFTAVLRDLYRYQLNGGALASDLGVKRRGEYRGENAVHPVFRRAFHVFRDNLPMTLRKYRNVVIRCKAIAVEPLGEYQPLLRKLRRDNSQ